MKKTISTLLTVLLFMTAASSFAQKGYKISIQIKGLKDSTANLAYYYGKGQYYRDTTVMTKKGVMLFSHPSDTLEHGMYSLIVNKAKAFDLMVDRQQFTMVTDTSNFVMKMEIKGSEENQLFYKYLKFLNGRQQRAKELTIRRENGDTTAIKELRILDKEVREFIRKFHKEHEGSFSSNFIYALDYPTVPDAPLNPDGSVDSTFAYRYFKAHYFDNFNFSDERLLRTSTFHEKIMYYMDKLTLQDPDSLIKEADYLLKMAEENPVLFKYALNNLTSKYERSKSMGMDAVFVHLAKNYFMKGRAVDWFSEEQLEKLSERANALDPLLIGKKAPNIVVKDTAQKEFLQLYDINADFTIVYIWSPSCGHCKTATPKLKELYDKVKEKGVEVFGVGQDFENEEWIEFINKYELNWINGSDGNDFKSNFRHDYDVYSTPQTYLLDKDKKILSKKMSIDSLENILEYFLEKREKEKNEE